MPVGLCWPKICRVYIENCSCCIDGKWYIALKGFAKFLQAVSFVVGFALQEMRVTFTILALTTVALSLVRMMLLAT